MLVRSLMLGRGNAVLLTSRAASSASSSKPTDKGVKTCEIYRYNPDKSGSKPEMKKYDVDLNECGFMVLDAFVKIKNEIDLTLTFRRSCREGICGSCAMNISGENTLACTRRIDPETSKSTTIYPLPHMFVVKDLVPDLHLFFEQYRSIQPWLQRKSSLTLGEKQLFQSVKESEALMHCDIFLIHQRNLAIPCQWEWMDCTNVFCALAARQVSFVLVERRQISETSCAVAGLQIDHRLQRLHRMHDSFSAFKCHTIMNCTKTCPKNLNPAKAIGEIKSLLTGMKTKPAPEPAKF